MLCCRVMSLALTSSTSPMMDYERKEVGTFRDKNFQLNETGSLSSTVACHSLMQNKARALFTLVVNNVNFFCRIFVIAENLL